VEVCDGAGRDTDGADRRIASHGGLIQIPDELARSWSPVFILAGVGQRVTRVTLAGLFPHSPRSGPCRSSGDVVLTLDIRSPRRTRSSLDKKGDDEVTVEHRDSSVHHGGSCTEPFLVPSHTEHDSTTTRDKRGARGESSAWLQIGVWRLNGAGGGLACFMLCKRENLPDVFTHLALPSEYRLHHDDLHTHLRR